MDLIKIGRFIAERRKTQGFTQARLAEMLGITDRAVSKWERGLSLPDASIMLELCRLLGISVNDLLCGEVVCVEYRNEQAEKNLLEMIRQKEEAGKQAQSKRLQIGSGDRSERIRTYNFPQSRVTDHRFGISVFDLNGLMEGDLDQLLDLLLEEQGKRNLEEILSGKGKGRKE